MKPLYSDNHVLILQKPPGVATQPDFHEEARSWVKKTCNKPGNVFLEPIHRLDKPVGGLVLFARTSKALSRLQAAMRDRLIAKTYLARVEGELPEEEGVLRHHLLHGNYRAVVDLKGKEAILHYRKKAPFVEIDLITGRYHQIRAQFSAVGHPIIGDRKYGSKSPSQDIALLHWKISFPHPISKEKITVSLSGDSFFESWSM